MIDLKLSPTAKLLWLDMEMTGLDPDRDRILEVAVIVTDFDFKHLDEYSSGIYQDDKVLDNMCAWSTEQHNKSGLVERVRHAPPEAEVEQEVIKLVNKHFTEPAILAGNSIYYDRMFIRKWWPNLEKYLHYRIFDVSTFKTLMQTKYGLEYIKKETHRALGDIEESIAELKYYLEYFKSNQK